jgi:hypothetical protein
MKVSVEIELTDDIVKGMQGVMKGAGFDSLEEYTRSLIVRNTCYIHDAVKRSLMIEQLRQGKITVHELALDKYKPL